MSKVHELKAIQKLPVSPQKAWEFFSDPRKLAAITPEALHFQVTNEVYGDEVYAGQVMTYTLKPMLGIPVGWMTEITQVEKEKMFVDEQRKGPYKLWHHQHHFKPIEGGVEMTDLVHYRIPFGIFGSLAQPMVKRKLMEIFHFRYQKINEMLGRWPGQEMDIRIH